MHINRHNYEEFFILYLDNELGSQERDEVEAFAAANPDLGEELDMLKQTRFVADKNLVFEAKETLMRSSSAFPIDITNYEEWLLLYIDDELNADQKTAVENFVASHPVAMKELDLLQQTKLQPEEVIVFFDKESLYRKEETSRRIVMMRWTRVAVAAILLFAISLTVFLISTRNSGADDPVVARGTEIIQPPIETPVPKPIQPGMPTGKQDLALEDRATVPAPKQLVKETRSVKENYTIPQEAPRNIPVQAKENEPLLADAAKDHNHLPEPTYNPNMKEPLEANTLALTNLHENNPDLDVTSGRPSAYNLAVNRTQPAGEIAAADQSEKKSSLRGLLRKVTRTFEKATSIKATDEDDRLLVAGLAIRL